MSTIFTFLLVAAIAGAVIYTLLKTRKNKADDIRNAGSSGISGSTGNVSSEEHNDSSGTDGKPGWSS